jgi:hypothetical protein
MPLDKVLRTLFFNWGGRAITVGHPGEDAMHAPDPGPHSPSWTRVGCREGLTPGHFRVHLRYRSPEDARRALASAAVQIENGVAVAHLDVPVVSRGHDWEHENRPPEIRWQW